jgi:hypothetical protein
MPKSDVRSWIYSAANFKACVSCFICLAAYPIASEISAPGTFLFNLAKDVAALTGLAALWLTIRALSNRIPQMGKPYYSDDGMLSALSEKIPRDLTVPWLEVIGILLEFLIFAGAWVFVFHRFR